MCLPINHMVSEGYFTRKCVSFHKLPQGTLFLLKEENLTLKTQWNLSMKETFQQHENAIESNKISTLYIKVRPCVQLIRGTKEQTIGYSDVVQVFKLMEIEVPHLLIVKGQAKIDSSENRATLLYLIPQVKIFP